MSDGKLPGEDDYGKEEEDEYKENDEKWDDALEEQRRNDDDLIEIPKPKEESTNLGGSDLARQERKNKKLEEDLTRWGYQVKEVRAVFKDLVGAQIRAIDDQNMFIDSKIDTRRDRKGNQIQVLKFQGDEIARYYKGEGKWKYLETNVKTLKKEMGMDIKERLEYAKEKYEKSVSSVVEQQADVVLSEPVVEEVVDNANDARLLDLETRESKLKIKEKELADDRKNLRKIHSKLQRKGRRRIGNLNKKNSNKKRT